MPDISKTPGFSALPLQSSTLSTLAQPTFKNEVKVKEPVSVLSPQDTKQSTPLAESQFEPLSINILKTDKTQPLIQASDEQVTKAVNEAVSENYQKVPPKPLENRHELNQRLQLSDPSRPHGPSNPIHYDGSDVVVISFEGTGAFEPRRLEIMSAAAEKLKEQGLKSDSLYGPSTEGISEKTEKKANWSGLNVGVHSAILNDRELQEHTQILSFPSEESELFRGEEVKNTLGGSYLLDSIKEGKNPFSKLEDEIIGSVSGRTPGIDNALIAMRDIQAQAKAQGKTPKFVIVGHSSGGRSMVKFLERAQSMKGMDGNPLKFELAVSIDPVREAHEAALEGVQELINKAAEHTRNGAAVVANKAIPFVDPFEIKKVYPPTVGYKSQPESLYVPSNVPKDKYFSFYQRADTAGLEMGFGIHGSKVDGAINKQIFRDQYGNLLGRQGHGEITSSKPVVTALTEGIRGLLRLP